MSHLCAELHQLVQNKLKHEFPFDVKAIPKNGIYILFEKGEVGHGGDRIVRIGTHTGMNQLRSRLNQHFVRENKDRSIFRKNIGRCLLHSKNDPYLQVWELDRTSSEGKKRFAPLIQPQYQAEIESQVSR